MKRKWALLMAGVMAFGMAMTGSAAEAETNTDLSGTLEVWGWTTDPQYQIEAFEKAYPNVTVNYTMIGTDYDTKMQTIVDNRTEGPDVFYADVKTVKNYIESDAWETLTDDPYNIDVSDSEDYTVKIASDSEGAIRQRRAVSGTREIWRRSIWEPMIPMKFPRCFLLQKVCWM